MDVDLGRTTSRLELGADDDIIQPFRDAELIARIRAQLRRARGART